MSGNNRINELKQELFAKYQVSPSDESKVVIKPMVSGRNVKALLSGDEIIEDTPVKKKLEPVAAPKEATGRKKFTEQQDERLRLIYASPTFTSTAKEEEMTLSYWANEWGVSRGTLMRRAETLGISPVQPSKKQWSQAENAALTEILKSFPLPFVKEELFKKGFKRSELSIQEKLRRVGTRRDELTMEYCSAAQFANHCGVDVRKLKNELPVYNRGRNCYFKKQDMQDYLTRNAA